MTTTTEDDNGSGSDQESFATTTEHSCLLPHASINNTSTSTAPSTSTSSQSLESSQGSQASTTLAKADANAQQTQSLPSSTSTTQWATATALQQKQLSQLSLMRQQPRGGINFSSNVLLVYRLQDMRSSSNTNLMLALLCLIYLGINVTLVCVNSVNHAFAESHPPSEEDDEPVDDTVYHLVEFWATFGFAVVECVALVVTPKSQYAINGGLSPLFLRMVMFINIVATAVPAVMISFSIETFEIVAHEIEYINELTMSFVDIILLASLWKSKSTSASASASPTTTDATTTTQWQAWCTTGIALTVAIVQLGVYNLMGYDEERGDMIGETLGHFLEFSFEIISSLIAFWFCMDNKFVADKEIGTILYGVHKDDCQICEGQMTEFALDHNGQYNNTNIITSNGIRIADNGNGFARPLSPQRNQSASSYYQTV